MFHFFIGCITLVVFLAHSTSLAAPPSIPEREAVVIKAPSSPILYINERWWLTVLRSSGRVPEPLVFLHDISTMVLAHAGTPVTAATLPEDWPIQIRAILSALRKRKCQHNDLKPSEILVDASGKLRVIDFGFAT